jgi:Fe-S cluster assembly protein SufB
LRSHRGESELDAMDFLKFVRDKAEALDISDDQLFYCRQRGLTDEEAVSLIVNGFCREVLQTLPMEFAVEAQKLVGISLEGSVG